MFLGAMANVAGRFVGRVFQTRLPPGPQGPGLRELVVCGLILALAAGASACRRADDTSKLTELERVHSGTLDVIVLSPHDELRRGTDTFIIEFRSSGRLVDVGTLRATASMPMPGMAMFGDVQVQRTDTAGRYVADGEFDMAGTWRIALEWEGPAGRGSVAFAGTVR